MPLPGNYFTVRHPKFNVPCFLASIQGRIERAKTITPISAARKSASTIKAHTSGDAGRTHEHRLRPIRRRGRIEVWLTDSLEELSSPNGGWADQRLAEASGGPSDQRSLPPPESCRRRRQCCLPAKGGSTALPQLRQTNDESPPDGVASVHCVPQYGQRMADMIGWHVPELAKGVETRGGTPFASSGTSRLVRSLRPTSSGAGVYFCTLNLWTVDCL